MTPASYFRDRGLLLLLLPVYFTLSHAALGQPVGAGDIAFQSTVAGHYEVRFDSQPKPIVINQIQSWVTDCVSKGLKLRWLVACQNTITGFQRCLSFSQEQMIASIWWKD